MKQYNLLNNITGWLAFLIAMVVYALTLEPTGSLWDCGEFISAAAGLQVVHPPGAPLFLLIGRLFSLFAADPANVAIAVNMVSATSSALCVLFTVWITTHFGKRLMLHKYSELSNLHVYGIMLAGFVAGTTLTFTDTFWFSAVEAEVYAMASFIMSFTFWAILKWEARADLPGAERWIVFIGFLVGLAVGVHLLNLLVIPAIVLVYYFKKYKYSVKGLVIAFVTGFALLFFVQLFVIPWLPNLAAKFDMFFVNSLGLGFGSGVIAFTLIVLGLLIFGLWWSTKKQKFALNTALLCFAFILIGYTSYAMVVIRSMANTPIDMNNPQDALNLVYYLNREQYGDRPLLKGPHYNAQPTHIVDKGKKYVKGESKYEYAYTDRAYGYADKDKMFFPRVYDGNEAGHIQGYKEWAQIPDKKDPKMADNLRFFFRYQLGHMYWRYFFWNFAGRQNDNQGLFRTDVLNGNWISGVKFIDAFRLGPQSNLPDHVKNNKSRNTYFMLPFILGIMGLFMHYKNHKNGTLIMGILFVVTGLLLIVYLNPPPYEPRERDYVFVGSFQVFCTWIGFGVLFLFDFFSKYLNATYSLVSAGIISIISGPVILGTQNWDDHDRSGRYMSTDFAKNYLSSCAPNSILFTNGDNDTYPLWFVQNVEKFRTDVRVVNLSLLNAADYVESLRRKQYDSEPFKLTFEQSQIQTGKRDVVYYKPNPQIASPDQAYDLKEVMQFVANDTDPRAKVAMGGDRELVSYLPTKKFRIKVNKEEIIKNKIVAEEDLGKVVEEMVFELPSDNVSRSTLILLDIIANNLWDRPVYFTTTTGSDTYIGMQDYFELAGLTYKVVPIYSPATEEEARRRYYGHINTTTSFKLLTEEFKWGGMNEKNMWVDDKMRMVPNVTRETFNKIALKFVAEGKNNEAVSLLQFAEKSMPDNNLAFDGRMLEYAETYYAAEAKKEAQELMTTITNRSFDMLAYLNQYKSTSRKAYVKQDIDQYLNYIQYAAYVANKNKDTEMAEKLQSRLQQVMR